MLGEGIHEQIKEVYKFCCQHATQPQDEIFLFGYSRGAFTARTVANIIEYMRMPESPLNDTELDTFYSLLRRQYPRVRESNSTHQGNNQEYFRRTKPSRLLPRVKFVGVFDTVKAFDDEALYDITPLAHSRTHYRQALALNEPKKWFKPEFFTIRNESKSLWMGNERSLLQGWFIGSHSNLSGAYKEDGIDLYPLQWMLSEAQGHGLRLGYELIEWRDRDGQLHSLPDQRDLIFPRQSGASNVQSDPIQYRLANGIVVRMWDLRQIHDKRSGMKIKFDPGEWPGFPRESRQIFNDRELLGNFTLGSLGTFIHPSVYLVLDLDLPTYLASWAWPFMEALQNEEAKIFADETTKYWLTHNNSGENLSIDKVRVMVCGPDGVGKSTVVNRILGSDVTTVNDRSRGVHDINVECTVGGVPIILHDSCGFREGSENEIRELGAFLQRRSEFPNVTDRIHAIWYCINPITRSPRAIATPADEQMFTILKKHARHAKIILVITTSDRTSNEEQRMYETTYMESIGRPSGALSIISVSQADQESIRQLRDETTSILEDIQLKWDHYESAQLSDVDLKVGAALKAAFEWINIWKEANTKLADIFAPSKIITRAGDPILSIWEKLCKIVLTNFGYSNQDLGAAACLMSSMVLQNEAWKGLQRDLRPKFVSPAFKTLDWTRSKGAQRILMLALIDQLLIAEHLYWIAPGKLTAHGVRVIVTMYDEILSNVHTQVVSMLERDSGDVFILDRMEAPIRNLLSNYRYKSDR